MKKIIFTLSIFAFYSGCGVKSDPVPPVDPVEIGRGKPRFEGASREMRKPLLSPLQQKKEDEEREE